MQVGRAEVDQIMKCTCNSGTNLKKGLVKFSTNGEN